MDPSYMPSRKSFERAGMNQNGLQHDKCCIFYRFLSRCCLHCSLTSWSYTRFKHNNYLKPLNQFTLEQDLACKKDTKTSCLCIDVLAMYIGIFER